MTDQTPPPQQRHGKKYNDYDAFDLEEVNWERRLPKMPAIVKQFYTPSPPQQPPSSSSSGDAFRKKHNITVSTILAADDDNEQDVTPLVVPDVVTDFEHPLVTDAFPAFVSAAIKREGFRRPTPIQAQSWPIIMQGHDMIGIAETGSGKTLAFLLPAITHLLGQASQLSDDPKQRKKGPLVLVLAPTRELVQQLQNEASKMIGSGDEDDANDGGDGQQTMIRCACVYGGENRKQQIRTLRKGAHIMVATPGRLLDYIQAGIVSLKHVSLYVLDEGDRMLDLGFSEQIEQINSQIRPDRQTVMFSATWNKGVQKLSEDMMSSRRLMINIGSLELSANDNVRQEFLFIHERDKVPRLLKLMDEMVDGSRLLIFGQTRKTVDFITSKLRADGWPALSLHGERAQKEREWVIQEFRTGEAPILVATDVAARGLDIPDVKCVINFDLPLEIENYVHRIGRTGRAGKQGHSISFFTPLNSPMAAAMIKLLRESSQPVPEQMQKLFELLQDSKAQKGKDNDIEESDHDNDADDNDDNSNDDVHDTPDESIKAKSRVREKTAKANKKKRLQKQTITRPEKKKRRYK